jgi:retron-type reverse transcriptase
MLRTAFLALKRDAAPGVDGLTWQDYETDLDRRIEDLHDRVHGGTYRALSSRRRYIPKPDGRQRPLAIAALEDKIVQRATVAVLNGATYQAWPWQAGILHVPWLHLHLRQIPPGKVPTL